MNLTRALLTIAAAALLAGSALPAATATQRSPDRYRLLVERNIFLRNRRAPRPPRTQRTETVVRDSDAETALTGVARRGGQFVAFFENSRTGALSKARVGERIGKGTVKAIAIDGIEYEREGRLRQVSLGRSLAGVAVVRQVAAAPPTSSSVPAPPAGGAEVATGGPQPTTAPGAARTIRVMIPAAPAGSTGASVADILEKLRLRRERELRR